mmetsp:Transcript_23600/g.51674  ORF Transcript_23600/g.51674 Transcript_23600/m.51674 type:complete len:131 (+) Transcript_23600:69-461(+)|eukprot:CAMPEP_0194757344 /NCGR_PEP_ID=MMETSP0323_2-20130528/10864_1 /TAXON_ID=2866 ORGANISM="Crypthecodinium cohnii, Strain Seligo" /NCGR_SAMPLE_ID=MMETSP0323_2 /ASSEMBLY_ACC=CAM_ASM_000346 /LENGTH=130 /DNA_ID=CAMNT_0039677241 /DNA_START=18 /DNA_END=410 /DNA_ORIENTATION=+
MATALRRTTALTVSAAAGASLLRSTSLPASAALAGPAATQVRFRQWLFPMAGKGFRPEKFEHMGAAVRLARNSKRIPMWKLAWAAGISPAQLKKVETGRAMPHPEQTEELERLLGVQLKRRRKSKIDRAP